MLLGWARKRVVELEAENLCGFIFKSNSPTSGMERIKVYSEKGVAVKTGIGIFARIFMKHFPLLPVEDENRLRYPVLRDNFIERIFALERWRDVWSQKTSRGNLVDFHTKHKLLILAHSSKHYQLMRKLIATQKNFTLKDFYNQYETLLMESLKMRTAAKKHANVLQHMMEYFKERLSVDEKKELIKVIDQYREGYLPLIVPATLISQYARKYNETHLSEQVYLVAPIGDTARIMSDL